MTTRFILASLSPRRRELIQLVGYPYDVETVSVDENSVCDPDPAKNCVKTAQLKSSALVNNLGTLQFPHTFVIAADTIVAIDGQILGKPKNEADAFDMLTTLRNRIHKVHTGISIINLDSGQENHGIHTASVKMRDYNDQEITDYIATGDPLDKAGAYAIQNPHFMPAEHLDGCFLGVMGLSVCHLLQQLTAMGLPSRVETESLRLAHQDYPCPIFDKITRKHG